MTSIGQVPKTSPIILKWLYENFEFADGSSISRSTLYYLYLQQCTTYNLEPLNSASFGKLIRSVFVNIKTRRLGTRGNSKYHYYGLKIKPQSNLIDINKQYIDNLQNLFGQKCYQLMLPSDDQSLLKEDQSCTVSFESSSINPSQIQPSKLNTSDCSVVVTNNNVTSNTVYCDLDLGTASHFQPFLGNLGPLTLPNFDSALTNNGSSYNMPLDILSNFLVVYKEHVESLIKAVLKLQFSQVELLWKSFWDFRSNNNQFLNLTNVINSYNINEIASYNSLIKYIENVDTITYDYLIKLLIKDILEPIPCQLTQAIRSFAKHMVIWIGECVKNAPENMAQVKIVTVNAFSQTLKRFTSLNHLAQAARNILQNQDQISQMLADLDRLDITTLKQQAFWLTDCQHERIDQIYDRFRVNLKSRLSLEEWAIWCQGVLLSTVQQSATDTNDAFAKKAKTFLLHWSFYGSALIKDLTLKSAPSFGSFHILRLLFEDYMSYLVEEKIAKRTGQTTLSMLVQSMQTEPQSSVQQNESHQYPATGIDGNSFEKLKDPKENIYFYPKTSNDDVRVRGLALNHVPPSISPSEMITKTHERGDKMRPPRPQPIKYMGGPSASLYDTSVLGDFGGAKRKQHFEDPTVVSGSSKLKAVDSLKQQQQQQEDPGDPVMKLWPLDKFDTEKLFNDTAFEYIDLITSYNLNMPHKSSKATTDYGHFNDDSQINYDSLIFDR